MEHYIERRAHVRAPVCATAVVSGPVLAPSEHVVHDLSAGGVFLCGRLGARPGAEVRVRLDLGIPPLVLRARVVHARDGGVGLQFLDPPAVALARIAAEVRRALERPPEHWQRLLVVEPDAAARAAARAHLAPVGDLCTFTETTLDAIQILERAPVRLGLLGAGADDFVSAMADAWEELYPRVRWRRLSTEGRLLRLAA